MKIKLLFTICLLLSITSFSQKQDSLLLLFNTTQNDSLRATLLYDIGLMQEHKDSMQYYFREALAIATGAGEYYIIGKVNTVLGVKKFRANELDSGLYYYLKSKEAFVQADKNATNKLVQRDLANTLINIAIYYYYQGNRDITVKYLHASLEISLAYDLKSEIFNSYNILAMIREEEDKHEASMQYFLDALDIALELNDTLSISMMYNNLAVVHKGLKEYEKALDFFNKSLEITEGISLEEDLKTKVNIGATYTFLGEYDKAKSLLLECVTGLKKLNASREEIIANNLLGDLYVRTHEWRKLLEVSKYSLKLLEDLPILEQKKYATLNLSIAYENLGNSVAALKYHKMHKTINDSIYSEHNSQEIERLEAQFEFEKKEKEIGELTAENLESKVQITEEKNIRYVLIGFIVSGSLLFLVVFLNFKRKQEKKRHKLALMKAEIEQRLLRSQMNPHFIFNALNSIQSYIMANQSAEAEVFLAKFSKLIRNILEHSTHEFIDLDDEVSTLQLYLELEKLRFSEKFDFNIDIQLSNLGVQIPPMLIQPFVENAIIHGMKGKKSKGQIDVRFIEADNNMIRCEIEDNGVGRKIKSDSNKKHQSLAIKLTNDRLNFFNQESESSFDMRIIDLKDDNGNPIGTKVELLIPMES